MTELSVISISILLISIVSFFFSPLEKNYVRVSTLPYLLWS